MKRALTLAAIVGLLSAVTAGATAAWMTTGSGSGTAKAATLAATSAPSWSHPQAFTTSANSVQISWTPSTSSFTATYDVERSPLATPNVFATVGSVTAGSCTGSPVTCVYTDTTASFNASYLYRVRARAGDAWTATSGTVRAITATPASASDGSVASLPPLEAVAAVDQSKAWAVGANGTILATTEGSAWSAQTSNTTAHLRGVAFADATHGIAVGSAGTILTSDGSSWTVRASGVTVDLHAVAIIKKSNDYYGLAVGANGTILRSSNGGASWTSATHGTAEWRGAWLIDDKSGFVVGSGGKAAYMSNSAWANSTMPANLTADLEAVTLAEGAAIAVGRLGTVLKSTNSGQSWTADLATNVDLFSVARAKVTGNTVTVLGGAGGALRTRTADNASWTASSAPAVTGAVNGLSLVNSSRTWAVSADGKIAASGNIGAASPAWTVQYSGGGGGSLSAAQVDALDLAADGQTYTTNGSWPAGSFAGGTPTCAATSLRIVPDLASTAAGSALTGASVMLRYSMSTTNAAAAMRLLVSGDGGTSWTAFSLPTPSAAATATDATVSVLSVIDTVDEAKAMTLCFEASAPSGSTFTTTHDLVHVDLH